MSTRNLFVKTIYRYIPKYKDIMFISERVKQYKIDDLKLINNRDTTHESFANIPI